MINIPCSSSWDVFEQPTMSLGLIPSIPPVVGLAYRSGFFSENLKSLAPTVNIRLLRLYLGRELPTHIHELQEGLRSDLALDVGRYTRLADALEDIAVLPPLKDIAYGMGVVLSQLHWGVGVDGMDAKLVIGGDGTHGLRCGILDILDYNQCSRWLVYNPLEKLGTQNLTFGAYATGSLTEGAMRLATRIAHCEQYYPKPSQKLYEDFKRGYLITASELVNPDTPCWTGMDCMANHIAILEASDAFIYQYEEVCRQALERKAKAGNKRLGEDRNA